MLDDGSVQYLQGKGLKVLLTVTNGWQSVGWSEFTSETATMEFAQYLKTEVVEKYGLDGIDSALRSRRNSSSGMSARLKRGGRRDTRVTE